MSYLIPENDNVTISFPQREYATNKTLGKWHKEQLQIWSL